MCFDSNPLRQEGQEKPLQFKGPSGCHHQNLHPFPYWIMLWVQGLQNPLSKWSGSSFRASMDLFTPQGRPCPRSSLEVTSWAEGRAN